MPKSCSLYHQEKSLLIYITRIFQHGFWLAGSICCQPIRSHVWKILNRCGFYRGVFIVRKPPGPVCPTLYLIMSNKTHPCPIPYHLYTTLFIHPKKQVIPIGTSYILQFLKANPCDKFCMGFENFGNASWVNPWRSGHLAHSAPRNTNNALWWDEPSLAMCEAGISPH